MIATSMWLKDSQMQILQLLLKNKEGLTLTQIHEELSNKVAKSDILNDLNDLLTGNMVTVASTNSSKKDACVSYCFNEAGFKGEIAKKIINRLMEMK